MTVPDHLGKAEEFAAEAVRYLGQGGGEQTAAAWAAVAPGVRHACGRRIRRSGSGQPGKTRDPRTGAVPPVLPEPELARDWFTRYLKPGPDERRV